MFEGIVATSGVLLRAEIRWGSERPAEAEGVGLFAHRGDAKGNVLIERDTKFLSAFGHVFAADRSGESLVFHPFFHGTGFEVENAL